MLPSECRPPSFIQAKKEQPTSPRHSLPVERISASQSEHRSAYMYGYGLRQPREWERATVAVIIMIKGGFACRDLSTVLSTSDSVRNHTLTSHSHRHTLTHETRHIYLTLVIL